MQGAVCPGHIAYASRTGHQDGDRSLRSICRSRAANARPVTSGLYAVAISERRFASRRPSRARLLSRVRRISCIRRAISGMEGSAHQSPSPNGYSPSLTRARKWQSLVGRQKIRAARKRGCKHGDAQQDSLGDVTPEPLGAMR